MRDPRRLVEPTVLARAGARALVGALVGLPFGALDAWVVAPVLGLAGAATPFVERAALLRDLERDGTGVRPALEASAVAGSLWALVALQLVLVGRRVGPEARAEELASSLVWLGELRAHQLGLLAFATVVVGALLGAPSGALTLDRLAGRKPDSVTPEAWLFSAALLLGLLTAAVGTTVVGGPATLAGAFAFVGAELALAVWSFLLYVLDRLADAVVRLAGAPRSEVESREHARA